MTLVKIIETVKNEGVCYYKLDYYTLQDLIQLGYVCVAKNGGYYEISEEN